MTSVRSPVRPGFALQAVCAAALAAALLGPSGRAVALPDATPPSGTTGWTVYHGNPLGTAVASGAGPISTSAPVWTSPTLDGQLYGQPLDFDGRVYVATENDTVFALDESTGGIVWSRHLGAPVPASALPCGDIQPVIGITGTPVIDSARSEIFVVADELVSGTPAHMLVGLGTASGQVELSQDVDPPGADPAALLQRTGLTLDSGRVVFGYGGNYGDCSTYHGWVVAVGESGGTPLRFEVDAGPGQQQGAVWMGGAAPVVDASGNVWVGVGNGSVTSRSAPYDDSDSVLELSPSLRLVQYFAPTTWASDNASDLDVSTSPVLLADGQVLIAGKSQIAYLLDGTDLGGIGGQTALLRIACGNDVDGGSAVLGGTVILPCLDGPVALEVSSTPPGLRVAWRSTAGGGPPVVAAGLVWTIGQDGTLYGLDPTTGVVRQQAPLGVPANHFPTPGVGADLLLAPSADRVLAFSYGASTTPASVPPTTRPVPTTSRRAPTTAATASGGPAVGALAVIATGGAVVLAAAVWLLVRWRRGKPV